MAIVQTAIDAIELLARLRITNRDDAGEIGVMIALSVPASNHVTHDNLISLRNQIIKLKDSYYSLGCEQTKSLLRIRLDLSTSDDN